MTCLDAGAAVWAALVALRTAAFPTRAGRFLWGSAEISETSRILTEAQDAGLQRVTAGVQHLHVH